MIIRNSTRNTLLAADARVADSFFGRLRGLLGTKRLADGAGLLIKPCGSVHTFGMNYAIDVIFADAGHRILKTAENLKPGKAALCLKSCYVVELPAGTLARTGTVAGDQLAIDW